MATATNGTATTRAAHQGRHLGPRRRARSPTRTSTAAGSRATGRRTTSTSPRTSRAGPRSRRSSASRPLWIYSMFFYGEDAVTDGLSPYIDAAPKEEQKYFLATQQVDEARHSVFFHRFFKEVIGAGDSLSAGLAFTEPYLNWGYKGVFDRLESMGDELRRDRSLPKFAQAITLYHLIIEASMAQPGPALHRGLLHQGRDDARLLRGHAQRRARRAAPHRLRREGPLRAARGVRRVQGGGRGDPERDAPLPRSRSSSRRTGTSATRRPTGSRWRTSAPSGCARSRRSGRRSASPSSEMANGSLYPFDPDMPHDERADRQIKLLQAGVLGEPDAGIVTRHSRGPGDLLRRRRALGQTRRRSTPR